MNHHPLAACLLSLVAFTATAPAQGARQPIPGPINAILGDESFARAFGDDRAAASAPEALRIATHLRYVEDLLRARDVRDLPEALQDERRANLERLHRYRLAGVFPRNFDHSEARRPCFIDRDGRLCAVGHLVAQSAGSELAEA